MCGCGGTLEACAPCSPSLGRPEVDFCIALAGSLEMLPAGLTPIPALPQPRLGLRQAGAESAGVPSLGSGCEAEVWARPGGRAAMHGAIRPLAEQSAQVWSRPAK